MTRQAFLDALRAGLAGLPPSGIDEIIADYDAHFSEGAAAGRSEAEVAAALGEPGRLARELRAEAGLKRWEDRPSASNAAAAVIALLGLGAVDILVLLPLLMGVVGVMVGCLFGVIGVFLAGGGVFAFGPFSHAPGGPVAALLTGLGLMSAAASGGAILTIATIGLVNLLVWYARLHFRLLDPVKNP
jgi:uncharacterized membrane protein